MKNWLPVGGPTVTESPLEPVSSIVKDLVSVGAPLERLIFLKSSLLGVTLSLLLATSPVTWAGTLAADKIVAATMNDATAQSEDANRNLRRTIVTSFLPPMRAGRTFDAR